MSFLPPLVTDAALIGNGIQVIHPDESTTLGCEPWLLECTNMLLL